MSNKIGRFEIISEISRSEAIAVYKATDSESAQTVALKVLKLESFGDQAKTLVESIVKEVESNKALQSPNIALLNSAEEVDGSFCASMEYIQGNSVATTLSRKEGFSIWDLLDIARQTRQGLDHAWSHKVAHHSLEPAKIMVTWDGTVKLLGFGISQMSAFAAQAKGQAPAILHYMSPEQLRGDPIDARSNLFSLGAIFYEMMTECKAFQGEDADQVRQQVLESTPVPPHQINKKINPALSEVILKSLAKDPEQRYQTGQELVEELEKCKNSPAKTIGPTVAPGVVKAAVSAPQARAAEPKIAEKKASTPAPAAVKTEVQTAQPEAEPRKAAAAAGWGPAASSSGTTASSTPKLNQSDQFFTATAKASVDAMIKEKLAKLSASPAEVEAPKLAVDPLMSESKVTEASSRPSFSDVSELPPLKEVYVAPAPTPAASAPEVIEQPEIILKSREVEKPRVQPREVAKKAVTEIKKTPPKLFGYSIAGAVAIILLVIAGIAWHIHSENSWDESTPAQTAAPVVTPKPQPAASVPPAPQPSVQPAVTAATSPETDADTAPDSVTVEPRYKNRVSNRKRSRSATPVILPGQLTVNSTPVGAEVTVDGQSDPSWVTPLSLTGVTPGRHTINVSKAGYTSEARTIDVGQGSKAVMALQLGQLSAGISVTSTPTGAEIYLDGRDTGRQTPAQISVDKQGNHNLVVRKQGYLEETTLTSLQYGQTFRFAPTLRLLGVTDDIKYKKLFGGKNNGMASVNIKTTPKGAQIAVNRRILDKNSPVEFYLNPGMYVIDITASGYKTTHKIIEVSRDGKVNLDENMDPE
ncbi:MAG TPA: PEGA domain-containing protein [Terriglobales bacterium]|jgi:serine/threonine-protein kinase